MFHHFSSDDYETQVVRYNPLKRHSSSNFFNLNKHFGFTLTLYTDLHFSIPYEEKNQKPRSSVENQIKLAMSQEWSKSALDYFSKFILVKVKATTLLIQNMY